MAYKPIEIERMLTGKLGMSSADADHLWFELQLEGLATIRTKLPNHREDIGDKLESRIHKQLRVRKKFFVGLMDCSQYLKDYERQVRTDPFPPFNILIV